MCGHNVIWDHGLNMKMSFEKEKSIFALRDVKGVVPLIPQFHYFVLDNYPGLLFLPTYRS